MINNQTVTAVIPVRAGKINYYREHGIDFGYFNKVNDFSRVSNQVIDSVKEYYKTPFERELTAKINACKDKIMQKIRRFIVICKIIFD